MLEGIIKISHLIAINTVYNLEFQDIYGDGDADLTVIVMEEEPNLFLNKMNPAFIFKLLLRQGGPRLDVKFFEGDIYLGGTVGTENFSLVTLEFLGINKEKVNVKGIHIPISKGKNEK